MSDSHDIKDAPVAPLDNEIVEIEGANQENEEGQEQQTQFNFHQEGQTSANYNYPYMQGPVNGMMVPVYLPPMAIPMYPGYYAPNAASYLWPAASYGPGSYPVMYMPTPQYDPYEQSNEYQETGYETEEGQQETTEQPGGQQQQQQQQSTETSAPGSAAPGAQQNQPLNANQQRALKHRVRVEDRLAKTELCRTFARLHTCPYGQNCQFAHGVEELRPRLFDSKFKTEYCANYHKTGACRFGSRCKFIHDDYWEAGPNGQYILISPSENVVRMELPTQRARILQLEALSRNRLNLNLQEQAQLTDLLNNLRVTRKAKLDNQRAIVTLPLSSKNPAATTPTDAKTTTAPAVATTSVVAATPSAAPVVSNSASASTSVLVSAASSPEFPALPAKMMEVSMVAPAKRSFLSIVASTNKPVDPPGA